MRRLVPALLVALTVPAPAAAYDWPLKPFDAQHPVRSFFDDPRRDMDEHGLPRAAFHSGIDIVAHDGTVVYAIEGGTASLRRRAVVVTAPDGHGFGYWHVVPSVQQDQLVTRHQPLGRIVENRNHLHLAETEDGKYVNPLRVGGLAPYRDETQPVVADTFLLRGGRPIDITAVRGVVDLVADAYDTPPLAPPAPWSATRVTPSLVRWRLLDMTGVTLPWRIGVDFRLSLLKPELFGAVYAPGTRQNRASRPGRYRFYLARGFDTRALAPGVYVLQVCASDVRRNRGFRSLPFRVLDQSRKRL